MKEAHVANQTTGRRRRASGRDPGTGTAGRQIERAGRRPLPNSTPLRGSNPGLSRLEDDERAQNRKHNGPAPAISRRGPQASAPIARRRSIVVSPSGTCPSTSSAASRTIAGSGSGR